MLSRGFVVLWVAMLVAMSGIGMVSPLLPVYVREDLGGPEIAVALSFSGVAVAMLVAAPFVGRLGDRFGVKRFIVAGFAIYGITGFGYLIVNSWELVIALRIFSGIGVAMIFPLSMAYVGRLAPAGREGAYMGVFSVAQIGGFGIGPLIGGVLRDAFSSDVAFATMALLLAGTGLFTFLLLPPRPLVAGAAGQKDDEPQLAWSELLRRPFVQAAMSANLVLAFAWAASGAFLAIYVVSEEGLGTDSVTFVGILFGGRAITSALLQPLFGRLADRVNRLTLVMIGLGGSAVGQFLVPSLPDGVVDATLFGNAVVIVPWLLVLYMLVGVSEALAFPAQTAIFVTVGRTVGMSSIMGVNQMSSSIGFLGGSLIGAAVVSSFGIDNVFRYAGAMTAVGAVVFFVLMRRAADEIREAELLSEEGVAIALGGD